MNKVRSLVLSLVVASTMNAQQAIKNRTSDTVMKHLAVSNGGNPSQIQGWNNINWWASEWSSSPVIRTAGGTTIAPDEATTLPTTIPNETIGTTTLSFNNAVQRTRQSISGAVLLTLIAKDARADCNSDGLPDGHFTDRELPTLQTNGNTIPNNTRIRLTTPTLKSLATWGTILPSRDDRMRRDVTQNKRVDETINPFGNSENSNRVDRAEFLGIDDVATMGSASIYPNPSTGLFTINTKNPNHKKVEVYSISGQLVKRLKIDVESTTIDISDVSIGQYVITTEDSVGNKTVNKIIKK